MTTVDAAEVVISGTGIPIVRLVSFAPERAGPRRLGGLGDQFVTPDDCDAPLPDDLLDLFESR